MSFKKTYVQPFLRSSAPISGDALYWKNFTTPILLKEVNSIDYIDVSPIEPNFVAVTCSARVQLYHPITRMVHKNYNRFKEAAHGAVFRNDGKLLVAGSDEGAVRLFDVSSKNQLRVFKGHQRSVHRCAFLPTDNQIVSFSDDKSIIQWDMASEALLHKYQGHTDYVRSGGTVPSNPNLILSGSYDHTVRLWDKREQKEVVNVNHGSPVESVLITPNGSLLFTAGLTEIRVWDILSGGRLLSKISQHHKTITALRFASEGRRLLSASLDRHVKVYDMASFEVVHTYDYSSPILSLGISPNDKTLIVGMADGIIAISRKEEDPIVSEVEKAAEVTQKRRRKAKTYSDFVLTEYGIRDELVAKDKKYDAYLRRFRYSKALDEVMSDFYYTRNPGVTVAIFQELIRRNGLKTALAGRKGKPLMRVLRFLVKHLPKPKYMRILLVVATALVELYASKVGQDPITDNLFIQLCDEVTKETKYMTELLEVKGCLNMLMAGAELKDSVVVDVPLDTRILSSMRMEPSEEAKQTLVVKIKGK